MNRKWLCEGRNSVAFAKFPVDCYKVRKSHNQVKPSEEREITKPRRRPALRRLMKR